MKQKAGEEERRVGLEATSESVNGKHQLSTETSSSPVPRSLNNIFNVTTMCNRNTRIAEKEKYSFDRNED